MRDFPPVHPGEILLKEFLPLLRASISTCWHGISKFRPSPLTLSSIALPRTRFEETEYKPIINPDLKESNHMTVKKPTAGSEIDSRCLKCKDLTNHTVIAMADDEIAKVQCNVCGGKHKYRPAKPEKASPVKKKVSKASAAKTAAALKEKKAAASFEAMFKERNTAEAKPYAMTATFNNNDIIDHPTFGLGLVTSIIPADKIEVMFKNGSKILICVLKSPEPSSVERKRKKGRMAKKLVV
jgi:hypothetical protein